MSDKTSQPKSGPYKPAAPPVPYASLSDEAKKAAREAWKAANPGKPNKADLEIDQAITAAGTKYDQDGEPV